jgi:hypothetical protein
MIIRTISLCLLAITILSSTAAAQNRNEGLSLTVTPPFIQISIGPGEFWASSLRVVNTNPYDLVIYASPMHFEAGGEEGHGIFSPAMNHTSSSLASWINLSQDPIIIPPESSGEVPFSVRIPESAPPGGHYAAILIGTKPFGEPSGDGSIISVSSFISSLFFVRVSGDVYEDGYIREVFTDASIYEAPTIKTTVRFENTGNVHLQPQGNVTIYDMWGRERAVIPINEQTTFGNVLPKSTRKFEVGWNEPSSIWMLGRYTVVATLGYGKEIKQHATRTTSFWIIPIRELSAVLITIFVIIGILWIVIRSYVRRSLRSALGNIPDKHVASLSKNSNKPSLHPDSHMKHNTIDLRRNNKSDTP